MNDLFISHVTTKEEWENAILKNEYYPKGFAEEGFIHCCTETQFDGVLSRYFKNVSSRIKLIIAISKLKNKLIYEESPSLRDYFPHIYGYLNIDAVIEIIEIPD